MNLADIPVQSYLSNHFLPLQIVEPAPVQSTISTSSSSSSPPSPSPSSHAAASSQLELSAATTEVITPFQPKLVRINGIPHLITTAESDILRRLNSIPQVPSFIPQQTTPYWRSSSSSQALPTGMQRMSSAPPSTDSSYVFNTYFHERKSACTVGFHPAISTTSFKRNIASRPLPVPVADRESSRFLQLDILPYHIKPFPEADLLSVESLLSLLTSFEGDHQLIDMPVIKLHGSTIDSLLVDKESSIARCLLKKELYAKFIDSNKESHETETVHQSKPESELSGSSSTSLAVDPSDTIESDVEQSQTISDGELEIDSETETEEATNINEGLLPSAMQEETATVSSGSSNTSSSSSSVSTSLPGMPPDSVRFVASVPPPVFPPGGVTTSSVPSLPSLKVSQPIAPAVQTPPIGFSPPFSHIAGTIPYTSVFSPYARHIFPQFPDDNPDPSSLWTHIRKLVEFVLQEVHCNLQFKFIELLHRILPAENQSWISSLAALYQRRLTWFERNQLLSFSDEMIALSNGSLPERIFFQLASIICLARISEASCERNVSRARAVFDRHKDHTLPQVANGLLLMSYHSLYKKLKLEKYLSQ